MPSSTLAERTICLSTAPCAVLFSWRNYWQTPRWSLNCYLETGAPPLWVQQVPFPWKTPLQTCTTPSGNANSHLPCPAGLSLGEELGLAQRWDIHSENISPRGCREAPSRHGYRAEGRHAARFGPSPASATPMEGLLHLCLSPGDLSDLAC